MKLVIFGSRDAFPTVDMITHLLDAKFGLSPRNISFVISGKANGADRCGETWARRHMIQVIERPADWKTIGKGAGHARNAVMAEEADFGLGFWKNNSGGTANMATRLLVLGRPVWVEELR